MDINADIIDQQVRGLARTHADRLQGDETKKRSTAFVLLCVRTLLELDDEEALDALTEGGGDADIDALTIGDLQDGEFVVTLLQAKYRQRLDGQSAFPANAIKKIIGTIGSLFDPHKRLQLNPRLEARVTEVRGLILDGNLPLVRVLLCNNGQRWGADGELLIEGAREAGFGSRVRWEHVNHERLIELQRRRQKVTETIQCHGYAVVEDFDFRRVFVGKVSVTEIKRIFDTHGDVLLDRNVRRYLGLSDNRVNRSIHDTLLDESSRPNFYFYNNGITAVCGKFSHNALQGRHYQVRVENLQIINGGQTCKTIQRTLESAPESDFSGVYVLLRLYEIPDEDQAFVSTITYATNSQNPVDLGDLRSNDAIQQTLALGIAEFGYDYKRKRDEGSSTSATITITAAAEAVMAVWRHKPHVAKFRRRRLFGELYDEIFSPQLNAAQVVVAVLIFRAVENLRRRPTTPDPPTFLPYASHFLAMLVGDALLADLGLPDPRALNHLEFERARAHLETHRDALYARAVARLTDALEALGVSPDQSLPRLAATFRRGDLLGVLSPAA